MGIKIMSLAAILERIITLNHAWKVARDEFGGNHAITESLKLQKSSWQATLLRDFPDAAYLRKDNENTQGEPLLSVRLTTPITINGSVRHDAEHMPERIAKHLFFESELIQLVR
jgi:hypothetical protein